MFDSLTMARKLTDVGIERTQAEVLADGMRQAAEHGDHVIPDMLRVEVAALHGAIAELRAELRADMYRAMLLQTGVTVGAVVAILRLLD